MIKLIENIAYWLDHKFSKKSCMSEEQVNRFFLNPFTVDEDGTLTTTKINAEEITATRINASVLGPSKESTKD